MPLLFPWVFSAKIKFCKSSQSFALFSCSLVALRHVVGLVVYCELGGAAGGGDRKGADSSSRAKGQLHFLDISYKCSNFRFCSNMPICFLFSNSLAFELKFTFCHPWSQAGEFVLLDRCHTEGAAGHGVIEELQCPVLELLGSIWSMHL